MKICSWAPTLLWLDPVMEGTITQRHSYWISCLLTTHYSEENLPFYFTPEELHVDVALLIFYVSGTGTEGGIGYLSLLLPIHII